MKAVMNAPDPIARALGEVAQVFEGCVVWAVRAILESEVKIKAPFEVVSSVPDGSSLYCILPTGNPKYHGQLVLGAEEEDFEHIFPGEMDPKVRKDAIGEMANVISGLFVADDTFISKFGYLKPSTPFFSEGAFTARKDWSLKGRIQANGKEIALQFSIRELQDSAADAPQDNAGTLPKQEGNQG
jgi:hypothetical protein